MSDVASTADGDLIAASDRSLPLWRQGLLAAVLWLATAGVTVGLPDVIPWGSAGLFAGLTAAVGLGLLALSVSVHHLGAVGRRLVHYGPWLIAVGVWFLVWEYTTAKTGWLPKPFFSPPHGLLNVYVVDGPRLLICVGYSLRLWAFGFFSGVAVGFLFGVALGWSERVNYWGMPVLKLIGSGSLPFGNAVVCLARDGAVCSLAQALCARSHFLGITRFYPEAFWAAFGLLVASAVLSRRRPARISAHEPWRTE